MTQRQANLNTNPARSAGRIKLNPTRPHIIRCIDISGIRSHREIHEGAGVGNRIINTVGIMVFVISWASIQGWSILRRVLTQD